MRIKVNNLLKKDRIENLYSISITATCNKIFLDVKIFNN